MVAAISAAPRMQCHIQFVIFTGRLSLPFPKQWPFLCGPENQFTLVLPVAKESIAVINLGTVEKSHKVGLSIGLGHYEMT